MPCNGKPRPIHPRRALSVAEASQVYGLPRPFFYRAIRAGELPTYGGSGVHRVAFITDIDNWLRGKPAPRGRGRPRKEESASCADA